MEKDLTYFEAVDKYPDYPRFIILKMDMYRRGVAFSDEVTKKYGGNPGPMLLRDGTSVVVGGKTQMPDHYTVHFHNGGLGIFYEDEYVEEIEFPPTPLFYSETTSRGTPMTGIANVRPQAINLWSYNYCHYFEGGNQCKFCSAGLYFNERKKKLGNNADLDPQDISETIAEILKEPGRFSMLILTGGSDPRGDEPFDYEVNRYIEVLQAVGENFSEKQFPSHITCSAFSKKQLKRLHDETGVMRYCPDLEVWDKDLFKWICPGKEKFVGQDMWINSMFDALEVFGEGSVCTNIVAGCEMAEPHGFKTVDEALKSNIEGCEYLAKRGISMMSFVFKPALGAAFHKQKQPPLEYYLRLSKEFHDIHTAYGLHLEFDDYKHCGNHAESDLWRIY